ncbi:hypothetical protein Hanom_Chr02g00150161 [Helianthus anomalus]
MVDFKIFDLSVFSCKPALLTYPPKVPNAVAAHVFEQSVDDEVLVTFVFEEEVGTNTWIGSKDGFGHQGQRWSNLECGYCLLETNGPVFGSSFQMVFVKSKDLMSW